MVEKLILTTDVLKLSIIIVILLHYNYIYHYIHDTGRPGGYSDVIFFALDKKEGEGAAARMCLEEL